MKLRITTFNCENLFNRYAFLDKPWQEKDYEKFIMAATVASVADRKGELVTYTTTQTQRKNTALAISEAAPDILIVNEVENLYTLRNFNNEFLGSSFDRMILIVGNDTRGINVGVLIKKGVTAQVLNIRTHVDDPDKGKTVVRRSVANFGYIVNGAIFSRDCLEIDILFNGKVVTLLANHLKAQDSKPAASQARRQLQAEKVAEFVTTAAGDGKLPIVLGDMNTDPQETPSDHSLDPLLTNPLLSDPFAGLSSSDRWTHFYESGTPSGKSVSRLDYILPHKDIKVVDTTIVRNGLSTKCTLYTGPRFPDIGPVHTEASDHCPVTVVLDI